MSGKNSQQDRTQEFGQAPSRPGHGFPAKSTSKSTPDSSINSRPASAASSVGNQSGSSNEGMFKMSPLNKAPPKPTSPRGSRTEVVKAGASREKGKSLAGQSQLLPSPMIRRSEGESKQSKQSKLLPSPVIRRGETGGNSRLEVPKTGAAAAAKDGGKNTLQPSHIDRLATSGRDLIFPMSVSVSPEVVWSSDSGSPRSVSADEKMVQKLVAGGAHPPVTPKPKPKAAEKAVKKPAAGAAGPSVAPKPKAKAGPSRPQLGKRVASKKPAAPVRSKPKGSKNDKDKKGKKVEEA